MFTRLGNSAASCPIRCGSLHTQSMRTKSSLVVRAQDGSASSSTSGQPPKPVSIPLSARQMREKAMGRASEPATTTEPSTAAAQWTTAAPDTAKGAKPVIKRRKLQLTGDGSKDVALSLAMVADELKGQDIMILDVSSMVSWTSYFVICTAINRPQMQAMMFRMEKEARDKFGLTLGTNPNSRSQWECMDFGSVVVHMMTPENRSFYDLESFYTEAPEVYLDDHIVLV